MRPDLRPADPALFARIFDPATGPAFIFRDLVAPAVRESYADLEAAARDADLLVSTPVTLAAPLLAERVGLAWTSAVLQPMGFFSARDPPVVPQARRLTAALHGLGPALGWPLRAFGRVATRDWAAPVRELRRELGLPVPGPDPLWEGQHSPALVLAMFSPVLARPQPDWPAQAQVTGFPFWDRADAGGPAAPEGLEAFLAAGPPPIVFTLGSAAVHAARSFYAESLAAARALGRRALLLVGVDTANRASLPDPLPEGALAVDYAPHAAVFPRAAAVVHQGGIGTLAQGLRAGRPMLVVPFSHDQPDNAARAARLGVARVLTPDRYSAETAARGLGRLLADAAAAARAAEVARAVRAEDGVGAACDAIEALLAAGGPRG